MKIRNKIKDNQRNMKDGRKKERDIIFTHNQENCTISPEESTQNLIKRKNQSAAISFFKLLQLIAYRKVNILLHLLLQEVIDLQTAIQGRSLESK